MSFLNYIDIIKKATKSESLKEMWDVSGIIKGRSNKEFKFDLRPISKQKNNLTGKLGYTNTKAEKMVFEFKSEFVIVDLEELHEYLKTNKLNKVYLEKLILELDWNIIIPKHV